MVTYTVPWGRDGLLLEVADRVTRNFKNRTLNPEGCGTRLQLPEKTNSRKKRKG